MNYFYDKNNKLFENIQDPPDIDPLEVLQNCLRKWNSARHSAPRIELMEVPISTTEKLIATLGDSSTIGFDELDSKILKMAAKQLLQPIHFILNLSIKTNTFPTKWKIGRIIPLHKEKSLPKHYSSSYRPITLLPVVSKFV